MHCSTPPISPPYARYGSCHTCEGMLGNGGQSRRQRSVLVLTRLEHRRSGMTPPAASLSVGLPSLSVLSGGVPQIPERSDLGQHLPTAALPAAPPLPPCSPSLTSSSPSDAEEEFILQALLRRRGRLLPPLNTMPGFKTIIKYLIRRIKIKKNKLICLPTAEIDQDSGKSKQQKANNRQEFVVVLCVPSP